MDRRYSIRYPSIGPEPRLRPCISGTASGPFRTPLPGFLPVSFPSGSECLDVRRNIAVRHVGLEHHPRAHTKVNRSIERDTALAHASLAAKLQLES